MYYVSKRLEIAGAHNLKLNYESKCSNLHGHNWIVVVHCKSKELNENGMVTDFAIIKKMISEKFDHQYFNKIKPFDEINPTIENIGKYLSKTFNKELYKLGWAMLCIEISESPSRSFIINVVGDEIRKELTKANS